MKIGFFDSGIGGLTILHAVRALMPEYSYVFFGDTKNVPYGNRTEEEIHQLTREGIRTLFEHDAVIVIVACNSASAESVRRLQDTFLINEYPGRKILGVIIPTIETITDEQYKKLLIIGTTRTIESKKYEREIHSRNPDIELTAIGTPTLVPHIEASDLESAFADLQEILTSHVGEVDGLVLGCTHYTVLKEQILNAYPELKIISQDEIIPGKLKEYLHKHPEIETQLQKDGELEIIFSAPTNAHHSLFKN